MRPLSEEETKTFFEKLTKFIGSNVKQLLDRKDEPHCFRLHNDRVYYISESMLNSSIPVPRKQLVTLGVCFGKFTHSGKFHLQITALDYLQQFCLYKMYVKPSAELSFCYGNNVLKGGLTYITENTPQYAGVVVFNQNEIPIGFGTLARPIIDIKRLGDDEIICFRQGDIGEYLRTVEESAL
eukprot:TRINITY_DN3058_c1_g2_i1.p1 TRINITY_DN3058_c1_g2~~TRINITY_DN3058_c1_g2_i1.p1  ORF type:complete len:193 (-),score=50.96 TRINITY_DN3058_c1_g2_i1:5-550(-)